jgi:cation transport ATPase
MGALEPKQEIVASAQPLVLRGAELLLSAPVVLWAALDYYRRGWLGVRSRSPNMYTLTGERALMSASGVTLDTMREQADELRRHGRTVIFLSSTRCSGGC